MRFQWTVYARNTLLPNKNPLIPVDIPTKPLENLAADLFVFNGKKAVQFEWLLLRLLGANWTARYFSNERYVK